MSLKRVSIKVLSGASPLTGSGIYKKISLALSGTSLYIEAVNYDNLLLKILVDTGVSSVITSRRLQKLGINLNDLDLIFITSWNYPHLFSLPGFMQFISQEVKVVAPRPTRNSHYKILGFNIPQHINNMNMEHNKFETPDSPTEIFPGVYSTGCNIADEDHALVLNVAENGLVVVSGNARSSISRILAQAIEITGVSKIDLLVGAFRGSLGNSIAESAKELESLKEYDIRRIAPCYLTEEDLIEAIALNYPRSFRLLYNGAEIVSEKGFLE